MQHFMLREEIAVSVQSDRSFPRLPIFRMLLTDFGLQRLGVCISQILISIDILPLL
jgi:hypothetical protein